MKNTIEEKVRKQTEDLTSAMERLQEALVLPPTRIHKDATIQRFEFTFELAWKLMQSFVASEGIEAYGPKQSIRRAAQFGIIADPSAWLSLLAERNQTTHIYQEAVADRVYARIPEFVPIVTDLLHAVKARAQEDDVKIKD